jgi:hypothetical protein
MCMFKQACGRSQGDGDSYTVNCSKACQVIKAASMQYLSTEDICLMKNETN